MIFIFSPPGQHANSLFPGDSLSSPWHMSTGTNKYLESAGEKMATFYSSEGIMLPTGYVLNQKLASYPSSDLPNSNKIYVNQPSVSVSNPNLLSGISVSVIDHAEVESISRDEMVFITPIGISTGMQQVDKRLNVTPRFSDGNKIVADPQIFSNESVQGHGNNYQQNPQYHGLSLSLGSQVPSLVQLPSDINQYTNSSLCSLLSSHVAQSEENLSQNNGLKNVEYLSFDLARGTQDSVKYEAVNNVQNLMCSEYLKAAQDLLDEVVNVHRSCKQLRECQKFNALGQDGSTGIDTKRELHETTTNSSNDLSKSERNGLQNKMTKLVSMLDEVDRRYKQYFNQMQVLASSFDMAVGCGAAQPYTTLAQRTISCQFRTLRDAIKKQIQTTQRSLGDQDANSHGQGVLSRLRFVDQQLRRQKTLQQFGVMRQPWRPQRGLPETAVSILRAWLFEHFLHPYPKDSEKIVLARQTGLTRSQVANWFINARVRLWKPMIEDMYKEEFGDTETGISLPENTAVTQDISSYDDEGEEFQGSIMSAVTGGNFQAQSNELRSNVISRAEIESCRSKLINEAIAYQENEVNGGLTHFQSEQICNVAGHSIFSDSHISSKKTGDGNAVAPANRYHDLMSDGAMGNQVSLALRLQHSEKGHQSFSGRIQSKANDAASSSMESNKLEYYYADAVNLQSRFSNPHMLSDFVS